MKTKKNMKDEIELTLKTLHKKIDSMKEKVDKLCETTDCFGTSKKEDNHGRDSSF